MLLLIVVMNYSSWSIYKFELDFLILSLSLSLSLKAPQGVARQPRYEAPDDLRVKIIIKNAVINIELKDRPIERPSRRTPPFS